MRPISRFGVPCCFSVGPLGGRRQQSQYQPRQWYQTRFEASRSWKPPSAAPWRAIASGSQGDKGLSSVASEGQNTMQQPKEEFQHENRDGSSGFPTFRSGNVLTKTSKESSIVKLQIKLDDSEDEGDLVIDVPPEPVNKKRRMISKYTNVTSDTELASAEPYGSVTGDDLGDGEEEKEEEGEEKEEAAEEESERIVVLQKDDRTLNKYKKPGNASPKSNEIRLCDVKTDTLKALEERDAHASTVGKRASSAAFIEAGRQAGILKQGNAKINRSVKAVAQKHTNKDPVKSGKQSVWYTGQSSKDETTSKRTCKKIVNSEEGQSIEENRGSDSPKESYTRPTYLNNEGSKTILQSSSVEELESSEEDSDDPIEECRRIFDEFEREIQKKKHEMQTDRENTDLNVLETQANIPGQKRRIAHVAKSDDHDAVIQQGQRMAFGLQRGKDIVATTYEQKKATPRLPAARFQSIGPVASLHLIQTCSGQLHVQVTGNVATFGIISGIRKASHVPCKISVQKKPSTPESGFKVPLETRQRYVSLFLAECFKICGTVNEAIYKALIEEQCIYDRCGSKNMYLNFAVKTLQKLREHGQLRSIRSCRVAGSITPGEEKEFKGGALYELLKYYLLTEEQLNEYNFPRPNPEKKGSALFTRGAKNAFYDDCAVGVAKYILLLLQENTDVRKSATTILVQYWNKKLHVHDGRKEKMEGFMKTFAKSAPSDGNYGIYALDCEMCYTTHGLELTRVTVVDAKLQVVYDTFVKPHGEVVDCDTRLSGVTEADLKNTTTSILEVQAVLLNLFNVNTILIGHSLENDLFLLKLIHGMVVDTSVVFPHRLGLPHKRTLRSLMAEYLRKIHQDDVDGCNSMKDAIACMELILWKIKEDNKRKKQ